MSDAAPHLEGKAFRRRLVRSFGRALGGGLAFAVAINVYVWVGGPFSPRLMLWICAFSPLAIAAVATIAIRRWQPPPAGEKALQAMAETSQRLRRTGLLLQTMAMGAVGYEGARQASLAGFSPTAVFLLSTAAALGFGLVCQVMGVVYSPRYRRLVDDELTEANRASALKLGFVTVLIVGAAAYLVSSLDGAWRTYAMPATLFAGVAATALRFSRLEGTGERASIPHG